ncbi:GntR family transcriptional regulator [Deinococcus metallilatus]|nr:GntR family transcriptional regulator [Deinococcus metallilatus]MBB5297376.1 DNA-binding GntR family transcriptional regulator [Deinococcus metallilatus]GMA17081.1 transcriptional regulator [Deinococcus metallilatus]
MTSDQRIYDTIVQGIMEQRLPPGLRLPEVRLSAIFGVSRERIRRILLRLSEANYVDLTPNEGARVYRPTPATVHEMFGARRLIESQTVREACARWTPQVDQDLRALLAREHHAELRGERATAIRLSGEFHLRLAEVAGNQVLLRFLRELTAQSSLALALYGRAAPPTCENHDHDRLLDELAAGQAEEAVRLMERHLREIEARLDLSAPVQQRVDLEAALSLTPAAT